jgi:glycerophosphoryl diester phosphodiesterase
VKLLINSFLKSIQRLTKSKTATSNLIVIAHRGASGYAPENTMAAFKKALELKADYIELDVQMTKDGELVVIHDTNVSRTTNSEGEVKDFTYQELKKLDAGKWFHMKFSGQRIPSLQEVISEFHGKLKLLIEIKNPNLYPNIAEVLANELKKNNLHNLENNEVIVQSFDFELLQRFNKFVPNVPLGLLVKYRVHGISNVQLKEWSTLVQYINPNKALVTKKLVKRIQSYQLKVMPYTVRDMKSIKGLLDAKVDGIVTDYPDYFKS